MLKKASSLLRSHDLKKNSENAVETKLIKNHLTVNIMSGEFSKVIIFFIFSFF